MVMRETHHAPEELELVREFVNTRDVEEQTDELEDAAGARRWLRAHRLVGEIAEPTAKELERLVAAREALRELLLANNGGVPAPAEALAVLNEASSEVALGLRFEPEGSQLLSACGGIDSALAEILARVHASMQDGTWTRLKACPAEDCQWAFYDRSRNRSATWCRMGDCGNRSKARAFRERHRQPGSGD